MSKTGKAEFIDPRAEGLVASFTPPIFDQEAATRADAALMDLSGSFQQWLEEEIAKVQAAREAADAEGWSARAQEYLYLTAHDLKGLGTTYDYPLATKIAASLCRLIETDAGKAAARREPKLARAHVDALRAVARQGIKSEEDALGRALLRELEGQVAELGVAPR